MMYALSLSIFFEKWAINKQMLCVSFPDWNRQPTKFNVFIISSRYDFLTRFSEKKEKRKKENNNNNKMPENREVHSIYSFHFILMCTQETHKSASETDLEPAIEWWMEHGVFVSRFSNNETEMNKNIYGHFPVLFFFVFLVLMKGSTWIGCPTRVNKLHLSISIIWHMARCDT